MWLPRVPDLNSATQNTNRSAKQHWHSQTPNINHNPKALRVIALIVDRYITCYFCLLRQGDGLCTAFRIFLEEYRDDTAPTTAMRKTHWGEKVRDACELHQDVIYVRSKAREPQQVSGSVHGVSDSVPKTHTPTDKSAAPKETASSTNQKTDSATLGEGTGMYRLATSDKALDLQQCQEAISEIYVSIDLPRPALLY